MSSASSSSPTTSPTSGPGKQGSSGGFFSAGGSPALVLAFLAIGIFAGGLISMLFLRRFALRHWFRRSWTQEADNWEAEWTAMLLDQGQGRTKRRVRLGDKPKLWDLACPAPVSEKIYGSWKDILPLSAFLEKQDLPRPDPESAPPLPAAASEAPHQSSLVRWSRSRLPALQTQPSTTTTDAPLPTLRVAVAVLMPLRREPSHSPTEEYHLPVYELGLVDLSWDGQQDVVSSPDASPDTARGTPPA